jgi:hypothetical protein
MSGKRRDFRLRPFRYPFSPMRPALEDQQFIGLAGTEMWNQALTPDSRPVLKYPHRLPQRWFAQIDAVRPRNTPDLRMIRRLRSLSMLLQPP